jgi:hypothetical protein
MGGIIRDLITMIYGRSGSALVQGEDMRGKSQVCSCLRVLGTDSQLEGIAKRDVLAQNRVINQLFGLAA